MAVSCAAECAPILTYLFNGYTIMDKSIARVVHLDLKGCPPKLSFLQKIFPLLRSWSVTGLLVEYEDTFPYAGPLAVLSAPHAYSCDEIKTLTSMAAENHLDVIPLIQTIGHLEFVLKHQQFGHLREVSKYPNSLCTTYAESRQLIHEMVAQVLSLHPNSKCIHIGADEVYHLGVCTTCQAHITQGTSSPEHLYIAHLIDIVKHIRMCKPDITVIAWDDMFRKFPQEILHDSGIAKYIEPMIWIYDTTPLSVSIWDKYATCFSNVWIASAFKGATGAARVVTNIQHHIDNHIMWLEEVTAQSSKFNIKGIALTGWQRYDHYAILCELLPQALPSLAVCLAVLNNGELTNNIHSDVSSTLNFVSSLPLNPYDVETLPECSFPGSDVYTAMLQYCQLDQRYKNLVFTERVEAWLNPYFIQCSHTNPLHVEHFTYAASQILHSVQTLLSTLYPSLVNIFPPASADEWINTFLLPKIRHLEAFIIETNKLLQWDNLYPAVSVHTVAMESIVSDI